MYMFNRFVTKKNFLRVSGTVFVLQIITVIYIYLGNNTNNILPYIFGLSEINIPIFLCSLIIYFLRESIFTAWVWFTILWIAASMVVISNISDDRGGGINLSVGMSQRDLALFYSPFIYAVLSLIIIISTVIIVYRKKK